MENGEINSDDDGRRRAIKVDKNEFIDSEEELYEMTEK
jgi:hypothetical protein